MDPLQASYWQPFKFLRRARGHNSHKLEYYSIPKFNSKEILEDALLEDPDSNSEIRGYEKSLLDLYLGLNFLYN